MKIVDILCRVTPCPTPEITKTPPPTSIELVSFTATSPNVDLLSLLLLFILSLVIVYVILVIGTYIYLKMKPK